MLSYATCLHPIWCRLHQTSSHEETQWKYRDTRWKSHVEAWQCGPHRNVFGKHGYQNCVRRGETEACRTDYGRSQYLRVDNFGFLTRDGRYEKKAVFVCVESKFAFDRCTRQGNVEAPRLWQKMAQQLLANVEEERVSKRMAVFLDLEGQKKRQICSFMWADNFGIMYHSKNHVAQILRDLIQKWDLAPRPRFLWISSYDPRRRWIL